MIERLRALDKAVELVAKATPGPWQAKNEYEWDEIIGNVDGPDAGQFHYSHVCSVDMNDERKPEHFANAELIIAAVNFIREHGSALIAELGQEVGAVVDEYGWVEGPPHRILSKEEGEWFIAETTYGDRVVLKGLPEEYAYDFTTADSTYFKRELIKRWRQFPDSEYKPLGATAPAHTSEARDAARYRWLRQPGRAQTDVCYTNTDVGMDAAIDEAMRQEGGK